MNKPYFNNHELFVIACAVFNKRLEAKMELKKIKEGKSDKSAYEYWKNIYDNYDNVYKKLVYYIIK